MLIITFVMMLMIMMLTHLVGALPLHLRLALLALLVKHGALDLKVVDHPFPDCSHLDHFVDQLYFRKNHLKKTVLPISSWSIIHSVIY